MQKTVLYLTGFLMLLAGSVSSCKNDKRNEKKLAGIWEAIDVEYITYQNNKKISDSVVENTGALYLYDDDELDNQVRYSLKIVPNGFTTTWEGNEGRNNTLMGTNIVKLTRRKLELTENTSDVDLNILKTVIYRFKRQ